MVDVTNRLKLQLVDPSEQFSEELWNRVSKRLDSICVSMIDLGIVTIGVGEKEHWTLRTTDTPHYSIHCLYPEDYEEWYQISLANFRVYIGTREGVEYVVIRAEGLTPKRQLHLRLYGWF